MDLTVCFCNLAVYYSEIVINIYQEEMYRGHRYCRVKNHAPLLKSYIFHNPPMLGQNPYRYRSQSYPRGRILISHLNACLTGF